MVVASIFNVLLAAITLDGVSGAGLSVTSELDANNVRIGDPVELRICFYGSADFSTIHAPALSRVLDRKKWRVDDAGAKTDTYRDARRLIYMVRPLEAGVLEFPALEFSYEDAEARKMVSISTLPIPVRVRRGSQIALAQLDDARVDLPNPDGIIVDLAASGWGSADGLGEDGLFAWRKACANPSAAAFAEFDFPEARLNEAACDVMDGNWARAMKTYSRLEWRIGQVPAIERGMVAALARRTGNPNQELPMWRQVMRPVLRHGALGRTSTVLGALLAAALLTFLVRRGVRALACLAVLAASTSAFAAPRGGFSPLDELERMRKEMDAQMQMMLNGPAFGGGGAPMVVNGRPAREAKVTASVRPDRTGLTAGAEFKFILSLEMPKTCTVSDLKFLPSQTVGYSMVGSGEMLTDGHAADTNNVVRRIAIPVRYDAPFSGRVTFTVSGMKEGRIAMNGGRFVSSFSSSFRIVSDPIWMEVKPLSDANRPADYSGAVGSAFRITRRAEPESVATNDVVVIDYAMRYSGFLPPGAVPGAVSFGDGEIRFRRYFVADGSPKTDGFSFPYYDVTAKDYRRATAPGVPLSYVPEENDAPRTVVVNAAEGKMPGGLVKLRFAPRESSKEVATADPKSGSLAVTETHGSWVRVDDGRHAGWIRKDELR